MKIMDDYARLAEKLGTGFDRNPSPGNIADGLVTDAIKSAGAVLKGGSSPITGVLDYTEPVRAAGLNLLCTPGGDIESLKKSCSAAGSKTSCPCGFTFRTQPKDRGKFRCLALARSRKPLAS